MASNYDELYRALEAEIGALLHAHRSVLPAAALAEGYEFLEHREYGLALEALVGALLQAGHPPEHAAVASIDRIASSMQMPGYHAIAEQIAARRRGIGVSA